MNIFQEIYPADSDFTGSVAAARVNGYLGGYGKEEELEKDLSGTGLSPDAFKKLLTLLKRQRHF
jgi:peptide-methionine (S)-S-oxide reductase